jgi:hypothetical protein
MNMLAFHAKRPEARNRSAVAGPASRRTARPGSHTVLERAISSSVRSM